MNTTTPNPERVFPLSTGSFQRPPLRAPQLSVSPWAVSGHVLGHRAFMRAWAARRAARAAASEATELVPAGATSGHGPPRGHD